MEEDYCKNYLCCNMTLPDMHSLLAHYEDFHVLGGTLGNLTMTQSKQIPQPASIPPSPDVESLSAQFTHPSPSLSQVSCVIDESEVGDKPFKCTAINCDKAYKNTSGLKYHISHSHPAMAPTPNAQPNTKGSICNCGKLYKNQAAFQAHYRACPSVLQQIAIQRQNQQIGGPIRGIPRSGEPYYPANLSSWCADKSVGK